MEHSFLSRETKTRKGPVHLSGQPSRVPHRRVDPSYFDDSVSTSTSINYHTEKPIIRTPRPREFNQWLNQYLYTMRPKNTVAPRSVDMVNSLATHRQWTSATAFALQEFAPRPPTRLVPSTTREESVDPVSSCLRSSNKCHHKSPMLWQELGRKWDFVQFRNGRNRGPVYVMLHVWWFYY